MRVLFAGDGSNQSCDIYIYICIDSTVFPAGFWVETRSLHGSENLCTLKDGPKTHQRAGHDSSSRLRWTNTSGMMQILHLGPPSHMMRGLMVDPDTKPGLRIRCSPSWRARGWLATSSLERVCPYGEPRCGSTRLIFT